jgi:hypothetical protein
MTGTPSSVRLIAMAKPSKSEHTPDVNEDAADEAIINARAILERVTGERMPSSAYRERAMKGAAARTAKLTPEERSAISRKGGLNRWKSRQPK